ncbi:chemotaxis protein CheW [endosymbiont of unidentified scaly snail isolate Monju]|uniref:chemotaxis protein CheW n=1 Tax=endosymbiont of unidentified scaly snail isolate Monju TaxID=1248727 RepID=UPI00038928CE|nr:chemotaxis protein CheW [endosymbiont of unidentified scaly snail isolate Monju]BAN69757.1 chemosensory pili system protein ChpC [endosymbiont of unidentified scaly snail isolate Monju]
MSDTPAYPREIRGLVIPLQTDVSLLLPNAAVAEIIDFHGVSALPDRPDWVAGETDWRQRRLSVVRFEMLLGESMVAESPRQRIVVCHVLDPQARRPFVGIVAANIPRLVRIQESMLEGTPMPENWRERPLRAALRFDGQATVIPDLPALERELEAVAPA